VTANGGAGRGNFRVSPHFRLREFYCRDGTPVPGFAVDDVTHLARSLLEPLRARYGAVRIISGYRPARYNARVGGAPASMHIYRRARPGAAADLVAEHGDPRSWYALLDELGAGGLGLYPQHVHVDTRRGHARW
jgi:uncharacterized protein YcbK (DUF882 family)